LQSNTAIQPSNIDQKSGDSVQICGINGGIPSRIAGRAHPKVNSSQDGRVPTNRKGQDRPWRGSKQPGSCGIRRKISCEIPREISGGIGAQLGKNSAKNF
jgi:hypothetical protein